jgi:hypothetical protein
MAALSSLVFLPAMVFHRPRDDTVQEFERPSYLACILGAPRSAPLLVAASATGKVSTQHMPYRVLGLRR